LNQAAIATHGENLNALKSQIQQLFSPAPSSLATTVTNDMKNSNDAATKKFAKTLQPLTNDLANGTSEVQLVLESLHTISIMASSTIRDNFLPLMQKKVNDSTTNGTCRFPAIVDTLVIQPQVSDYIKCLSDFHTTARNAQNVATALVSKYAGKLVKFKTNATTRVR
jgi:hypothetical protein